MAQSNEISRELDSKLVKKYAGRAFMYTEYPNKKYWSNPTGTDTDFRAALSHMSLDRKEAPTLLYVHTLHCQKQCFYCTCHTAITTDYSAVKVYLNLLFKEIDLLASEFERIGSRPNIKEIHLGGGTPTFMHNDEMDLLVSKLQSLVDFSNLVEFSIEIDPRRVKKDQMFYLASKGINRISFGIQDFDLSVQKAVNRIQPAELTERLLTEDVREKFPNGVSFDIICGLPKQTPESIRKTMEKVSEIGPDRVCLNYLHMAPKFSPHQMLMPQDEIPGAVDRKILFLEALDVLLKNGYVRTGYDHFAKPTDAVAKAMSEGTMQWNSLGATPGRCEDMMGIGVHSYGRLGPNYYYQNYFEVDKYKKCLDAGKFPIYREYQMTSEDVLRRHVIQLIRNYFQINFSEVNREFAIDFASHFSNELASLSEYIQDGVVKLSENGLEVTDIGYQFADMICEKFDEYHDKSSNVPAPSPAAEAQTLN